MKGKLGSAFAFACGCALVFANTALAATVAQASGATSPYASCVPAANNPGINYLNAEVEPQVAVNPKDTSDIVGQWHQDRWNNGGARGIGGAYSTNGGGGCGPSPCLTRTAPGRASPTSVDPTGVSFGPDGTAYCQRFV
jgi:hypothetical protein